MTKENFEAIIREAVQDHFVDFENGGDALREMEAVLHKQIAIASLRRTGRAKDAARNIGIGYNRYRRILKGE